VLRNVGVALATAARVCFLLKGLNKLEPTLPRCAPIWKRPGKCCRGGANGDAPLRIARALRAAEALTRGKGITRESLQQFIGQLAIPEAERQRLLASRLDYHGKARSGPAHLSRDVWRTAE